MRFDRYLGYEDLVGAMRGFAEEHPGLCEVVSIGKSREGREILLAEITNQGTGPASEKPAFWVDGNTHAGEVTGSMAALYLIQTLLKRHGEDDLVTSLLDRGTFYVLPRLSPDGAERYLTTPHTLRASTRPWPEPEEEAGLHPEDLDGDGHIVQMRVQDREGEWRVSREDPRLMVPRRPDESDPEVTYYRVYREGLFKDYDGFERKIARPLYGLDMNRQYPYGWREDHEQQGAGPYPLSEPESRAQVEALLARRNVFSLHTYHTFCGAILRPFSDKEDGKMPEHDLAVFKALGERGTEITGYPNISVYHDFRYAPNEVITGAFDDWAYSAYGVFAYTVEFWSMAGAAGVEVEDFIAFFRDPPEEASLAMLRWNDEALGGEGFVDWKPFDHPQLGRVEIGGWKTKFTFQNPPPEFLEAECEKLARFALAHASCAPRIEAELEVESLAGGLRRVEVRVRNTGYLPTNVTKISQDKGVTKPVKAEITLPEGASFVSGEAETDLGHLAGRSALAGNSWKSPAFFAGLPSDYAARALWVLRGDGPIRVEVRSEKAGTVRLEG
ncbi:MAG: M14 family metallopeptidase [Actinomycetota bacterium]|nr:M14 family metallopeptidase [Actinomycetota bacterium]